MTPTSQSLLERLKMPRPAEDDWRELHALYRPLVARWLARVPGLSAAADDLTQDVLIALVKKVPSFERRRDGSLRRWLRVVTTNRVRQFWRDRSPAADGEQFLSGLEDPGGGLAAEWDREHDRHVARQLLAVVERDFSPATWAMFRRFAVDGLPAADVAAELGTTVFAVAQAKARVMKRLREEAAGLLD